MAITITHSPDADDRFMFWALRSGRLQAPSAITFAEADTQRLNELALARQGDVLAVSAATYPQIAEWYQPLMMGCSMGDGYGPVVVAREPMAQGDLAGKRIAVPGLQTTAYRVLRSLIGEFEPVVVPIVPMAATFGILARGDVDAALVIHEGRLIYEQFGTVRVCELGELWLAETGTPLPLGMNVISRAMPAAERQHWADLFVASCRQGMAERDAFVAEYLAETPMTEAELRRYLAMYANDSTLSLTDRDQAGFRALYVRLQEAGFTERVPPLDWL